MPLQWQLFQGKVLVVAWGNLSIPRCWEWVNVHVLVPPQRSSFHGLAAVHGDGRVRGRASATLCVDELWGSRIFSFAKKVIAVVSLIIGKFGAVSQEPTSGLGKHQCLFPAGDQTFSERLRQYVFILYYLKGFLSIHSVFCLFSFFPLLLDAERFVTP